tara:strand:- start:1877 stop:2584 length:708 start_codon:yes stop_codon:yes gene_type:complete
MTLDQIAYNILNLIRGGKTHHDETISLSQLKFNIKYYRAMLLRRDFARNGLVTRHVEQDLGCLKLIKVDATKCCKLPIDCHVMRTEMKVPRTIRFNFNDAITYVGAVDGITRIPLVEPHMVKYLMWDKYTGKNTKAYMIEDYLYLYEPHEIGMVNIRGVFEDPEELSKFDCDTGDCYDSTSDFPIPADMISTITQGIVQGELGLLASTFSDKELDRHQDLAPAPNIPRPQQEREE